MKETGMGIMANAYYDFNNSSDFTPYVMLGLGVNRSKKELIFSGKDANDSDKDTSFTIKSNNKTGFAYQLGVGVGYEMSKDIHLDLAYKLVGRL
jgi:opacity protein-like surface antigen